MKTRPPSLSLIIPAFNEERRIGKSLEQILRFCNAQAYTYEVLVVDDGSTDETVSLVRARFGDWPQLRIIQQAAHLGKGGAVRKGMLHGAGEYLFFSDADLSVAVESLPAFLTALENRCDVAIGSRRAPGAKIEIHQPKPREVMAQVFTRLANLVLGLGHTDITCGFKGFRQEVARELFARQRLSNWSFDAEILFLARLRGYRIAEMPVVWRNDQGTKVRLWKDAVSSFWGLLAVRLNHIAGKYRF